MNYFVSGLSAEVSRIKNVQHGGTEFYLLVISDEHAIDPATERPRVLYKCTYSDPMDAAEAAVLWTDEFLKKRASRSIRSDAA